MKTRTRKRCVDDAHPAGIHRSPRALLQDSIERALGWASERELREIVNRYTGVLVSLGEGNRMSQEIAALVVRELYRPETK